VRLAEAIICCTDGRFVATERLRLGTIAFQPAALAGSPTPRSVP
jgi:hypothetical protein